MARPPKVLHDLTLRVLVIREKAILVTEGLTDEHGRQINHWLPLSQVEAEGDLEEGKVATITIPDWLVREKGLTID